MPQDGVNTNWCGDHPVPTADTDLSDARALSAKTKRERSRSAFLEATGHGFNAVNIADRNDLVAAEPDLRPMFGGVPPDARFDGAWTVRNGAKPHEICLITFVSETVMVRSLSDLHRRPSNPKLASRAPT